MEKKKSIELSSSEGHLLLYCKGWYHVNGVDLIEGYGRLLAGFCGWDGTKHDVHRKHIANSLSKIYFKCTKKDPSWVAEIMNDYVCNLNWRHDKRYEPIEAIILFYMSELQNIEVRNGKEILIKLPKPKKRAAKKIVGGKHPFTLEILGDFKK